MSRSLPIGCFILALTVLLSHSPHAKAQHNRREKEDELKAKYNNRISFGGQYNAIQLIPGAFDVYASGGTVTANWVRSEATQFAVKGAQLLADHGYNPANDEIHVGIMTFRIWKLRKEFGYNVFVPYLAIMRKGGSRADDALKHGDLVLIFTRRGYPLNSDGSSGPVQAIKEANEDPEKSDELFTVEKVGGGGELKDGDKVLLKTRKGWYLNSDSGAGKVQAIREANRNPDESDEVFTIRRKGGSGIIRSSDLVYFVTRRNYFLNSDDAQGPVQAIKEMNDDPAKSDEIFTISARRASK